MAKKRVKAKAVAKRNVGRPTDYKPEYVEQVFKLCLLRATDKEIADLLGVNEATLNRWKISHPEFCESMSAGREKADADIAKSLYWRARGYSHPEVHVSNYQGQITMTPLVKHYPPDTAAASLWLRNRQSARWRDKVDHELYGKDGGPLRVVLDKTDAKL